MGPLTLTKKTYLEERFAERVTFNKTERKLYSHDLGDLPRLIKPMLENALADAVVQPQAEAELVELVNWARENGVPLTPRGQGNFRLRRRASDQERDRRRLLPDEQADRYRPGFSMRHRAPLMEHAGHPVEERVILPESYIVTLTFRRKDRGTVMERLPWIIEKCRGELLDREIAEHEWEKRCKAKAISGPVTVRTAPTGFLKIYWTGMDDEIHGQDSRRLEPDETAVPGIDLNRFSD